MKYLGLLLLILTSTAVGPSRPGVLCLGAQLAVVQAAAQERSTPPGEWCQRPAPQMSSKAHACSCHKADCTDPDPSHLPAHKDANCLNYCTVDNCRCVTHDCP